MTNLLLDFNRSLGADPTRPHPILIMPRVLYL